MEDITRILDYFIDFEVRELLTKIEINKENSLDITKEELNKTYVITQKIHRRKEEKLSKYFRKIPFYQHSYCDEILDELIAIINNNKSITYEKAIDLIDKGKLKYPESHNVYIKVVMDILNDNSLLIMYPIVVTEEGKKRMPLVTFQCKFVNENYEIEEYKIQQDALELVLTTIFQCDTKEARDIIGKDFKELVESLSSINIDSDIYRFISILDERLEQKFKDYDYKSIFDINDYSRIAVADQVVISFDTLVEDKEPIFRKEIKKLKERIQSNGIPELIQKYIYGNKNKCKLKDLKSQFHFGSYKSDYPINLKQADVISSYLSNNFTAVSGPPGTGKTTVLKELIADNFVRKTKDIIEKWDEPWRQIGSNNQMTFSTPLGGNCNYSIIVASTNNAAVDNIGLELMKEIDYFSEIARKYSESYNGILCARLGKSDNIKEFATKVLVPFIQFLEKSSNDDVQESAEKYKIEFIKKWSDLSNAYSKIENYINERDNIINGIINNGILHENFNNEDILNAKNSLSDDITVSREQINSLESDCSIKEDRMKNYTKDILKINKELADFQIKASEISSILEKSRRYREIPIVKFLYGKLFKFKYGDVENIELQQLTNNESLNHLNKDKQYAESSYNELLKQIESIKGEIKTINDKINTNKMHLSLLKQLYEIEKKFEGIRKEYDLDCTWSDESYSFLKAFTFNRHELFELALQVNRAFIIKNKEFIKHNLSKVYVNENWFNYFYRDTFDYDDSYKEGIKAVWETLFICFPVVTTTLHSFSRNTFHMIEGIFDTIMIDEAGQVLLHYAVSPLYRARRAIIVGDTLQLEPIFNIKKKIIQSYEFTVELEGRIDIQNSSVQYCADAASDVFEKVGNNEKGIMLEEHRRCEESIMLFSNKHLYENKLKLMVKDSVHGFLGSSLCFIDTRGVKQKNNTNLLEVTVCKRIVDWFVEEYGQEYKNKIAIITPYKNQKELLKENIPDVEIGTVNTFQGREKEIVILSSVIQDITKKNAKYSSGIQFVGDKPNFLNVAFSRAKQQLLIVGNYNAYVESGNYLSKAIETINECGRIYSMYDMDLMQKELEEEFWEQLKYLFDAGKLVPEKYYEDLFCEHLEDGLLVGEKHYSFLNKSLKLSTKSIHIVSPWITSAVVNEEMIQLLQGKLEKDNSINICFGYNSSSYTIPNDIDEIAKKDSLYGGAEKIANSIKALYQLINNRLKYKPPMHTKALIIDKKFMVIGSHNWLSKVGERKGSKDEISCIVSDKNMMDYVIKRYFD